MAINKSQEQFIWVPSDTGIFCFEIANYLTKTTASIQLICIVNHGLTFAPNSNLASINSDINLTKTFHLISPLGAES